MDPRHARELLGGVAPVLERIETVADELQASWRAAVNPAEAVVAGLLLPGGSLVMAGGAIAIAQAAAGQLRAAAASAMELMLLVHGAAEEQERVSSATDGSYLPMHLIARDATQRVREALEDPRRLESMTAAHRAALLGAMTRGQIEALAQRASETIGDLEGAPYWARDVANRIVLDRVLADPASGAEQLRAAVRVRQAVEDLERRADEAVQLAVLRLPSGGGERDMRAALATGDLDAAANLGVVVPGMNSTVAGSIESMGHAALNLRTAEDALGGPNAVLAWIGYETPDAFSVASDDLARRGGDALRATLEGMAARRPEASLTVFAHSYGTRVATAALSSGASADGLFLFGSPGLIEGLTSVEQLAVPPGSVTATQAGDDRVAPLGLVLSQPGADHVVAAAGWSIGPIPGIAGTIYAGAVDPGGVNLDPAAIGARMLSADGDGDGGRVGGHDMANQEDGYMDLGSDSLQDMAKVGTGHGGDAR